jgi:sugar phosphate isomerase/epimerase
MLRSLNIGAIGHRTDLAETLRLAKQFGFDAIDFSIGDVQLLADAQGNEAVSALFGAAGVQAGSWGFPVEFRRDEATWRQGLAQLPAQAALAQALGFSRTATWIMPCDNERSFAQNFKFHVERLRPAAEILADHGIRFGLEFVGPRTLRISRSHDFIHTLDGMLALCAAIGTDNMGLLLDSYHLYTAHGRVDDLYRLSNHEIVVVHINDAPAGIATDEQQDGVRALPGVTGVLDLTGFLHALASIGYDGPVTVEPFDKSLKEMAMEEAVHKTSNALNGVWIRAGLV